MFKLLAALAFFFFFIARILWRLKKIFNFHDRIIGSDMRVNVAILLASPAIVPVAVNVLTRRHLLQLLAFMSRF